MNLKGSDGAGGEYRSIDELWSTELGKGKSDRTGKDLWYQNGIDYWDNVDATVDGVLGGYGVVSDVDCKQSDQFLIGVYKHKFKEAAAAKRKTVALDCGAGVGRVTENLLLRRFNQVDLVEPVKHFLQEAEKRLRPAEDAAAMDDQDMSEAAAGPGKNRAANFFYEPLESFAPEAGRYDVIWIQWVIGHLTDEHLKEFLARCVKGLRPGGLIVLKENNCNQGFIVDREDSSVTRSDAYFKALFVESNLRLLKSQVQTKFPSELYKVRMYALVPMEPAEASA